MKLRWLIYLGRQEGASHVLLLGSELVLFDRSGLVVGPVSGESALQELVLQVSKRELGLIGG